MMEGGMEEGGEDDGGDGRGGGDDDDLVRFDCDSDDGHDASGRGLRPATTAALPLSPPSIVRNSTLPSTLSRKSFELKPYTPESGPGSGPGSGTGSGAVGEAAVEAVGATRTSVASSMGGAFGQVGYSDPEVGVMWGEDGGSHVGR